MASLTQNFLTFFSKRSWAFLFHRIFAITWLPLAPNTGLQRPSLGPSQGREISGSTRSTAWGHRITENTRLERASQGQSSCRVPSYATPHWDVHDETRCWTLWDQVTANWAEYSGAQSKAHTGRTGLDPGFAQLLVGAAPEAMNPSFLWRCRQAGVYEARDPCGGACAVPRGAE